MTFSSRKTLYSVAGIAVAALGIAAISFFLAAKTHAITSLSDIESGDLVRGESLSAVYYMGEDGFRYVFPNDKTYFTWYEDFDDVKWISDADLAKIQIGGNVTYKPGVKMIKITSDSDVYYVKEGAVLAAIDSEETATLMYGPDWNTNIDDVADAFFSNYTVTGDEITSELADIAMLTYDGTINEEKDLTAPAEIAIDSGIMIDAETVTIDAGETVRFTNNSGSSQTLLADDNSWGNIIASGGTFVKRFEEAGTYTYYVKNTDITGAIIVE